MLTIYRTASRFALFSLLFIVSATASASGNRVYHVTITNLSYSISFTPIMVASHKRPISVFEAGTPASNELAIIAESGNVGPMSEVLSAESQVIDVQNSAALLPESGGLLLPGQSVTVVVSAERGARMISLASMMLPTNDGFIGLNSVEVPKKGSATYYSPGYDAGSEANDELCLNIPGPTCAGDGLSAPALTDEGYVHVHRGMHGIGSLPADVYDWRNPVARITVSRERGSRGN